MLRRAVWHARRGAARHGAAELHSGRTAGGRVAGEIYNIGTDVEFTNLQLAEYLLDFYGLTE